MRWLGVIVALLSSSCLQQQEESPESVDASVTSIEDAGPPFDPCAWNGRSGYCYAEMGFVFSEGRCLSVCGGSGQTNGKVFETSEECNATCSCRREKFIAPDSPSDPFVIGGSCDEVRTVAAAGIELESTEWSPWSACRLAPSGEQRCKVDVSGPFDLRDVATLCWVSALPQVRALECVVEVQ